MSCSNLNRFRPPSTCGEDQIPVKSGMMLNADIPHGSFSSLPIPLSKASEQVDVIIHIGGPDCLNVQRDLSPPAMGNSR
ncbi:MAG: hypothetical protein ACMUIA_08225 [bacterium]